MLAHDALARNAVEELLAFARSAAEQALPAHEAEEAVWARVLDIGRQVLGLFFRHQGQGDLGDEVILPDGTRARRLPAPHARTYRSIFGDFTLRRACYGSREGQAIDCVPLDARLQLPESDYSHLLQRWALALACESSFARTAEVLASVLGLKVPVDSLERLTRRAAPHAEAFRAERPLPEPKDEGEVFVLSADGKGIPLRRGPGDPRPKAHRGKGDKANKKRMAVVGAIYSVDRNPRTPEEVVAALFRDPRQPDAEPVARPEPVGKHVWGRLSGAKDGSLGEPVDAVFGWLKAERKRRDPTDAREVVCVMDGQELLWEGLGRGEKVPGVVEVLDLLHVTPRLWQAAHAFEKEGSAAAQEFVRGRLLRVLRGQVKGVVMGLRRQATLRGLRGPKAQAVAKACRYLAANAGRMKYDAYLRKGYPIASGVIEGACRSYVKDRMERAGMRWTKAGAQAMLDLRSVFVGGAWEAFQKSRIQAETERLYLHRSLLEAVEWPVAA